MQLNKSIYSSVSVKSIVIPAMLMLSIALLGACGEEVVSTSINGLEVADGVEAPDETGLSEEVKVLAETAKTEALTVKLASCRETAAEEGAEVSAFCTALIDANKPNADGSIPVFTYPGADPQVGDVDDDDTV